MKAEQNTTKEYTEFQRQAIESERQDICVAAGAGSGKTGVLVERFIRILTQSRSGELPPEQRAKVDEVLVITFTEKATKEMKSRIVAELNRLGLVEERRQVETAYISTIHGFCSRLLQENPFEAGVDPQFTVLDEPQAKRLLQQAFEETIAHAYERHDTELTELVAVAQSAREFGEESGDPLRTLFNATVQMLGKLRGAGRHRQEVEQHWLQGQDYTAARSLQPVWAFLKPLLEEITLAIEALTAFQSGLLGTTRLAYDTLQSLLNPLTLRENLSDTLAALEKVEQTAGKMRPRHSHASEEVELIQLFQRVKVACTQAKALFGVVAAREESAALLCHRFWGLLIGVWKTYDLHKRRLGCLDTDDLQAEGVRLLENASHVRQRYRRRFRHLMVDEFQDTDPLQMRLVNLLHRPEVGQLTPNNLFVVGDVQQSIYGFRNAAPVLFRRLERQFRVDGKGHHVPLTVNFRSRPEILQTIAQVFQQVWREERTPFVPLSAGAHFEAKSGPSLEILLTQDLPRRDYVRLEASALASRIQDTVVNQKLQITAHSDPRCGTSVSYRDIAVLFRALTDIQKYEEAFTRRGVPYYVVGGGRGYYARPEIRDLLNVLTVLETPLNDVALAAVLRSPFVGADVDTLYRLAQVARQPFAEGEEGSHTRRSHEMPLYPALLRLLETESLPTEETAKLRHFVNIIEQLRAQEDRLPVGHLLERLIAQIQYDARLLIRPNGRRRLANVRKLLQMANSDSVMGVREFIRRLRDMERLTDREGEAPIEEESADVVRLMTIHGAKGLEFPVVVLADLARSLSHPERGLFTCDPHHLALGTRLGGEPNVVYRTLATRRETADLKESERLLYVAMTRAREHLVLCGNIGRNPRFNWADNLFPLLGVLNAPPQPEVQVLTGGVTAHLASLSHYVHAPLPTAPRPPWVEQVPL